MAASRSSDVTPPGPEKAPAKARSAAPPAGPPPAPGKPPTPSRRDRLIGVAAFLLFLATIRAAIAWGPPVLLVHVFCAVACAFLAPSRGRRPYVWLHAGLAFGVFALVRLVRGPVRNAPPAVVPEAAVCFCGVLDFMLLCGVAQAVVEDRIIKSGRIGEPAILALMILFGMSAAALVWIHRSSLFRYMTTVKTSVALVSYLAIGSLAMTLILQQPDAEKAWLQDRELAPLTHDPKTGRPLTGLDKEYVKFMAAETGLAYGVRHLFDPAPPATEAEREEERRLQKTFGAVQGHNVAARNTDDRERRRKRLEKQALADETGDGLRPFFEFCRATRLYEIRRAWWFVVGILDVLAVCLVLVCVDRWKRGTKRYSFYFAHAGIVIVILGRHFTDAEGTFLQAIVGESRRGNLELVAGKPEDTVVTEFLEPSWRLPFAVRLDRFEVDYYKHWSVRVPDDRFGILSNTYLPRAGKRIDVRDADGGLWTLSAEEHHLSADVTRRLAADPKGPWRGALQATLSIPGAPFAGGPRSVAFVPDLPEAADRHLGRTSLSPDADDTYIRAVWAEDAAAFERESARALDAASVPFGRLEVRTAEGKRFSLDVPPRPGSVERDVPGVGRVTLKVEAVAKNWREAVRSAQNRGSLELWQQSEGAPLVDGVLSVVPEGEDSPRGLALYAEPSGFRGDRDLEEAGLSGWSFWFVRVPGPILGSYSAKVVVGPVGKAALVLPDAKSPTGATAVPLTVGSDVPVGDSGAALHVDAVLGRCGAPLRVVPRDERERGEIADDFAARSHDYVSASRFRVTPPDGGAPYDAWVTSVDPWPLRFGKAGEMTLSLEEEFGTARDFRSYVTVIEGAKREVRDGVPLMIRERLERADGVEVPVGGEEVVRSHLIQVNDPLWWRGYKLYQSRFNGNVPEFSGLIVKRDRGLPWIYLGLPLTFTGILWMLVVDPALARRRSRRKPPAPGGEKRT